MRSQLTETAEVKIEVVFGLGKPRSIFPYCKNEVKLLEVEADGGC